MRFSHDLANETPEHVFQVIRQWLFDEKAKPKQVRPPNYIEASHGRRLQPMGWRRDAKKTISVQISPEGNTVHVTIDIVPAALNQSDVNARLDEAKANWNDLLSTLWRRFGETESTSPVLSQVPNWTDVEKSGRRSILIGLVVFSAGLLLALVLPGLVYSIPIPATIGIIYIVNGAMNYRSAKKHLSSQH